MPSLMFLVKANALAMNNSGAGKFSHSIVKCSPIHASEKT